MKMFKMFRSFIVFPLILIWLAFAPNAQTTPDPAGCGGVFTTCDGLNATFNNNGAANSAFGWNSLLFNTAGSFNTGAGAATLLFNSADANTGVGAAALLFNINGTRNTAV